MLSVLSIICSLLFLFSSAPLIMAFTLVTQTILVSVVTFLIMPTSWFSFILFMIFISAMMVIFVYVSSLAHNEFLSPRWTSYSAFLMLTMTILLVALSQNMYSHQSHNYVSMSDLSLGSMSTYKLYAPYLSTISIFMIIYLLVALIAVAKNSSYNKGPLRFTAKP
uniref:NADH dehydrogenase subunit 6 n=1 Tax=Gammarus roeselii TaxID=1080772 RepID=A0A343VUM0_9CRUS|nr:NADH dehydrogenase subunit 6 [Gammarus roeselii]AVP50042.1 NADH dehydrogenase subunit 6 [Gammarus roeselii]